MAKKRLNKKVALVGSAVLIVLGLALIYLIPALSLRLGLIGPETFIEDGDAAIKAAHEATDEKTKAEKYKKAISNYHKARSLARTDSLRIKMLFKLVDIYIETDRWRNVRGCWNDIISIDPKNPKARFGRLKYFYIMADSGLLRVWQEVASQASEFIEVADANLLAEDTAKWETFGMQEKGAGGQRLGPYLYLLRGRANLEVARLGGVTDPDELLVKTTADLEKVRELEPGDPQAYWYLAQVVKTKGEILALRGDFEERDRAAEQAGKILKQAVEVAGADPRAHINLLTEKLEQSSVGTQPQEQIQLLEPEYLLLTERFPSSAEAFSALVELYQRLGHKNLDKAVEAAEKSIELDKLNVTYAINAANLHYRKFSIYGQNQEIHRAIEVAENALTLPDAQEVNGPRHWANLMNRISLYTFLANCYIEQILEPCEIRTKSQTQEWMADAEQAVHEIEQLFGSGEDPQVIKWRGMLELAKGNKNAAVRKLYVTYEQLKALKPLEPPWPRDPQFAQLSYALAKIFKDTTEVGAVREFLTSALWSGIAEVKPKAVLDYVEVLIKRRAYDVALSIVNSFEDNYWADKRSQTLRINALLGARQFDEAEAELARAEPDDPNTIKLSLALVQAKIGQVQRVIAQKEIKESSPIVFKGLDVPEKEGDRAQTSVQVMKAELKDYWTVCGELVEKLLVIEPNFVGDASVVAVCNNYISQGRLEQAGDIVNRFLGYFPDSTTVLFYKRVLAEPQPDKISQQRRKEIEEQVLSEIGEPIRRAVKLGLFYHRHGELDKAADEFKKVFSSSVARGTYREKKNPQYEIAVSYLFEIALEKKDWELAEEIVETVRRENIDRCGGQLFAARAAMAKEEYKDALARLEECLSQRPVFSHGFMLRSNVNAVLGNEHSSIEDARKAASLNPLDGTIAKVLANVLYQRNKRLGRNVSSDKAIEARAALENAMAMNPGDMELLSSYAEYISPTSEQQALAIRQYLQKTAPSVKNAVLLGRLATKMALEETDAERKEALFAIADSSFEQAIAIEPQSRAALERFAEYYRLTGQEEKAEKLLAQDRELLWRYYVRSGQFEDARAALEQLYKTDAKDSDVVKGLLLVAERTADKEAVQKYSEKLLLLEDSVENHLFQIQTFLKIGLVKEAQYKVQSFKEKYPDERRALLLEAWLAMRQGRLKEALELTNRSLQSNQNDASAWRVRGEVNFLMANYDKAIDDLKTSKALSPELDTHIALAKAYQRAGRDEDAITELKSTIGSATGEQPQAAAEEVPAERGARALLEQIYLQLGKKEALKKFYDETLRKFPDSVLWYNRAGAFAIAEGEFDRAEQLYRQAWQKGQKHSKGDGAPKRYEMRLGPRTAAFDGYLQALALSGKFDKVIEEGGNYVGSDLAPIAYLRMAEAKLKLGDKTIAIEYCRKAVDKAGTNEIFAYEVSRRMYSLLGAEEVLKHCEERLNANPDSLAANLTMFNLAKINGEYNKALKYIDKCLQIAGPDSSARVAYTMIKSEVLHLAYEKTSDNNYLKSTIAEYESLLAEMPNSMGILNNLAYMLAQNNERLGEALTFARRALDARPNDPGFLDTYAYALYKNGRNLEAAEFLQAAIQQYEQNNITVPAEVYEHLGQIREELGAEDEALAAYKQALEIVLSSAGKASKATKQRITSAIERLTSIVDK